MSMLPARAGQAEVIEPVIQRHTGDADAVIAHVGGLGKPQPARRKLIYSLIWQSVIWRPGKLRFLIGVKNPLPIGRPRSPENTAPCGAAPVARFATPVGLRPPFVTHPATLPHPD